MVSSALLLGLFAMGVSLSSVPILLASGILAFARPLLYVAMLKYEAEGRDSRAPKMERRVSPTDRRTEARSATIGAC